MNLWILDNDPEIAAQFLSDLDLETVPVYSAKVLATALARNSVPRSEIPFDDQICLIDGESVAVDWASTCRANFRWVALNAMSACCEFTRRTDGWLNCEFPILKMSLHECRLPLLDAGITPFVQDVPDDYIKEDAVEAYRNYYIHINQSATWQRNKPDWFETQGGT